MWAKAALVLVGLAPLPTAACVPTAWTGRLRSYAERGGTRVPLEAEVSWVMPEGPRPDWQGRITALRYEGAQ